MKTLEERFWEKVDRSGGAEACWPWVASRRPSRDGRYGQFSRGPRGEHPVRAHRMAWELTHGPIPVGLLVCHHCDNPPCCNPTHLFLGTPGDNMVDAAAKGHIHRVPTAVRAARARRAAAEHPERIWRGEAIARATLTAAAIPAIRARLARGESHPAIARDYGVGPQAIWSIAHGRTWRHVP